LTVNSDRVRHATVLVSTFLRIARAREKVEGRGFDRGERGGGGPTLWHWTQENPGLGNQALSKGTCAASVQG